MSRASADPEADGNPPHARLALSLRRHFRWLLVGANSDALRRMACDAQHVTEFRGL